MEQVGRFLAGFAIVSLLAGASAGAANRSYLTVNDLRKNVQFGDPQISPNGKEVLETEGRGDYDKDKTVGQLVVFDVATGTSRVLVDNTRADQFEWSPRGDYVSYIAAPKYGDEKSPQLFILPMNGGEPKQLTHEKDGVAAYDWRPDEKMLAYASIPEPKNQKALDHHEDAFDVTGEAWTDQEPYGEQTLSEVDINGGKPRTNIGKLTNVDGQVGYSADGRAIFAAVLKPGTDPSQGEDVIVRVNPRDGHVTQIANPTNVSVPQYSMDGKYVAHLSSNKTFKPVSHITVRDASGEHILWQSTHLDRNVQSIAFLPDDSILTTADDATSFRMFRVTATSAKAVSIGDLILRSGPSVARDGTIAFLAQTNTHPSELYVLHPKANAPVRVSNVNTWANSIAIGKHETINWHSRGMNVDGMLYFPPNYDQLRKQGKKLPLLLFIHGGPTGASVNGVYGMADVFAAHGWIVFSPNYAGSDNQGLRFASMIVPHITSIAGKTIEDGIDAVLAHTAADPQRMGVSGWSAGGMMTSWLITHDTRWKAAVDGAAVDDFFAIDAMSDIKWYQLSLSGDPYSTPERMAIIKDESPLTYASRVKTPTLILTDAGDFRVPTPSSYDFYHEIRATGTPVKMVIWPVVGHFPSDPVRIEDVYRQWDAWLAQYLK